MATRKPKGRRQADCRGLLQLKMEVNQLDARLRTASLEITKAYFGSSPKQEALAIQKALLAIDEVGERATNLVKDWERVHPEQTYP